MRWIWTSHEAWGTASVRASEQTFIMDTDNASPPLIITQKFGMVRQ